MKLNNVMKKKKIEPWSTKDSKYVFTDRWIKVRADDCLTAEGKNITPYYVLEYPHWVHMVVIDEKNRVLVTQQYRHGAKRVVMELPVGTMDKTDRNPLFAAKRELMEETGHDGTFVLAGITSPNPATHTNSVYAYLVTHPVKKEIPKDNPFEVMNYEFIPLSKLLTLIDKGEFAQAMHISSLFLALRKGHIKMPASS